MGRLFWKFFFAFWGALLAAGITVGSTVALLRDKPELDVDLAAGPRAAFLVRNAAATLVHGGSEGLRQMMREWQGERRDGPPLFVVDGAGRDLLGRPVPPQALAAARELSARPGPLHEGAARRVAVGQTEYLLFVPAQAGQGHRHPRRTPPAWLPLVAGLLGSLVFSALLAWHFAKPVRHLRWAFGAAAEGRLDVRVQPRMGRRRDEIADLGRDFDRMAARLQALMAAQRRLLHDVSHELRSPLARLQAAIGLLRQNPAEPDASLARIERESERLGELVGELLTLSRLEAGMAGATTERVELVELVAAIADDARFEARAGGRDLRFSGSGEAYIQGRAELLHRAFENVIRNAVKFTRPGTAVEVSLEGSADVLRMSVCDRGPGVPQQDLDAIFEPFYRSGDGAQAAGFGLGLAIARRAVEAHGGTIAAANRPDGGLCVEIRLPLLPNASKACAA
jgi:two-component system OmpR family sensor kinase